MRVLWKEGAMFNGIFMFLNLFLFAYHTSNEFYEFASLHFGLFLLFLFLTFMEVKS